jgi:LmbE family N-acetylglucosaminyl deacetylase
VRFEDLRVMVVGGHPDDADTFVGCAAIKWADRGARVRFVSVCNGEKGWHLIPNDGIAERRKGEAAAAARAYGIESYEVWEIRDCEIEPTVALRMRMTRMVRGFAPHVIITHRTCDYHADHRACSQLVQDMTYMLGLPNWCPEVPTPSMRPAVFFMTDEFDFPRVLRPDAVVVADDVMDRYLDALSCHVSQFFEFLPVDMGLNPTEIPDRSDRVAVRNYLLKYHATVKRTDTVRYSDRVAEWYGSVSAPKYVEVFEMSRYGRQLPEKELRELFGMK